MPTQYDGYWSYSAQECRDNMPFGVANITRMFEQATDMELELGLDWYRKAYVEAELIAYLHGLSITAVVQVACALSPKLSWENNMPAAATVIRHYKSGGYIPPIQPYADGLCTLAEVARDPQLPKLGQALRVNVVKALWILQGYTWVLRGNKVASFCDNILRHETSDAVTVDSHAIQGWFGVCAPGTYSVPPSYYDIIAADYRLAAACFEITPLQFQAVVWIVKKRLSRE